MRENLISGYVEKTISNYKLTYPLDIKTFIKALGFELHYCEAGKSDAVIFIHQGNKNIFINRNIKDKTRERFTLAHELGHYFIPNHLDNIYSCNTSEIKNNKVEHEREADMFAAKLLLPDSVVGKNYYIDSIDDIISVASKYDVSVATTGIRMVEKTDEIVCLISYRDSRVSWYSMSNSFKERYRLKDIYRVKIPKDSYYYNVVKEETYSTPNNANTSFANIWLDEVDEYLELEEQILHSSKYDSGYILLRIVSD